MCGSTSPGSAAARCAATPSSSHRCGRPCRQRRRHADAVVSVSVQRTAWRRRRDGRLRRRLVGIAEEAASALPASVRLDEAATGKPAGQVWGGRSSAGSWTFRARYLPTTLRWRSPFHGVAPADRPGLLARTTPEAMGGGAERGRGMPPPTAVGGPPRGRPTDAGTTTWQEPKITVGHGFRSG